ncbi:MAG: SpoIIE family protein phosphatase [Methylotenera sp.]|nr:SpoIIE family protein phosphatase [Oligoflexia bacterium]
MHITVMAADQTQEARWMEEFQNILGEDSEIVMNITSDETTIGKVIFVDSQMPDLEEALRGIERTGRAIVLIVDEAQEPTQAFAVLNDGLVDDVIVFPFRLLDVVTRLKHYQQIVMWQEVSKLNITFAEVLSSLQDDVSLAERLQKGKLPSRFQEIKGLQVQTRYLAGMRSGGDHFDLADSKDGNQLSVVLSDSSSYGLSSAVLSALMRVALKLSVEETRSSLETVRKIYDEIILTLNEKDKLSLFYGVLSRKDFKFRYLNLGSSCAFLAGANSGFRPVDSQGGPISKASGLGQLREAEIKLEPNQRLALISDGFVEALGGVEKVCDLLDRMRQMEPVDSLNELVFRVKSKFTDPDDMPEQDCTAAIFDVDAKLLRLA